LQICKYSKSDATTLTSLGFHSPLVVIPESGRTAMPGTDDKRFKTLIEAHLDALFRAAYRLSRNKAERSMPRCARSPTHGAGGAPGPM
jgi:hypothetical protein